jgi:hypothetical protein
MDDAHDAAEPTAAADSGGEDAHLGGEGAGLGGEDAHPGRMRARFWTIAASFNDPADYGIPPLPEWTVYRESGGGMALGAEESDGVFIAADDPVRVRR